MRQGLRAGALGRPKGMGWGGRREEGSRWGTCVNPWLIHVSVWQNPLQYCKVISFQLILKNEKKKKKQRHYCVNKVYLVKAIFFSHVWVWELDYKAEHQRLDTFELWCWSRLLRVPWTARRSNQSILKETNPEYSLEGLMLKLKPQYFGHLMQRTDSFENTLMLGKIEGSRGREWQRMRWLGGITIQLYSHEFEYPPGAGDGQGSQVCCSPWGRKESDMTERLTCTELTSHNSKYISLSVLISVTREN